MLIAAVAVAALMVIGAVVSWVLFMDDDEPFLGTVVFQSNVTDVAITMLGPDGMIRTGIIEQDLELSFTDVPEGNYWSICSKYGYTTVGRSGTVDHELEGGTRTFIISMETLPDFFSLYIAANSSAVVIERGGNGAVTVEVSSLLDFAGDGAMGCSELPSGVTGTFSPEIITLAPGGEASSELTLFADSTAPRGCYYLYFDCLTDEQGISLLSLLLQIR